MYQGDGHEILLAVVQGAQEQFRFFWRPGGQNLADYWTKHHPAAHHQNVRTKFLTKVQEIKDLRGKSDRESAHMILSGPQEASCKGVLDRPSAHPGSSWNLLRHYLKSAISNLRANSNTTRSS